MSGRFDEAVFRVLAASRLHPAPPNVHRRSDDDLNPEARMIPANETPRAAAVLVPLVPRAGGLSVLLTERQPHLRSHAGQVAFPGGRIDDTDHGPVAAALRETEEETGIAPDFVEPLGFLDTYLTSTNFRVMPVVGLLRPGFTVTPHEAEVAAVFEVPLSFLMDPAHHERHARDWQGKLRHYYAMPWEGHYIWGATAGMIRNLYSLVYETP
ncbi:MAG: CoA pyrophosphatase [Aestuariivirga sp.]|uniref:CoA pyrophosphatase n=1 Tax=Aestuariivirga sp. TaxID=2650926 RepID=UPI0038D0F902